MQSILLELWSFFNTYSDFLVLEPINFDVLVASLQGSGSDALIDEVHSALLTPLVDEGEDVLAISLPTQDEPPKKRGRRRKNRRVQELSQEPNESVEPESVDGEQDSEEEDEDAGSKDGTEQDDTENQGQVHHEGDDQETNNAAEFVEIKDKSWLERIGHRQFGSGGWQQAAIAVLYYVDYMREWKATIEAILAIMAPLDRPASMVNAVRGYDELPFPLRVSLLRILSRVLYTSTPLRQFMEKQGEHAAKYRKARTERLRELRTLNDTAKGLTELKNSMLLAADGESAESLEKSSQDFADAVKKEAEVSSRKQELEEEVAAAAAEEPQFDVHRLKMLGKDRFYNRYWWMEAPGLRPGDEDRDPTSYRYLMGRLWVQGPTQEDYDTFLASEEADAELTAAKQKTIDAAFESKREAERAAAERAGV